MSDITSNLFAHYKMADAADATIIDSGSNAFNLAVTADGAFPTRANFSGKAARLFSRVSTTVTNFGAKTGILAATYQSLIASDMTLACWYQRVADAQGTRAERLLTVAGDNTGVSLSKNALACQIMMGDTAVQFVVRHDVATVNTITFANWTIPTGSLHHYAVVVTNGGSGGTIKAKLYVDGTLVDTSADVADPWHRTLLPDAGYIAVGHNLASSSVGPIGGYVFGARLYARALAAGDITALQTAADDFTAIAELSAGIAEVTAVGAPVVFAPTHGTSTLTVTAAKATSTAPVTAANKKSTFSVG